MTDDQSTETTPTSCMHVGAPLPANEEQRIAALDRARLLDTAPEHVFDSLVQLAQSVCDVPIALVSLVDRERQWFKAKVGLEVPETHRDMAFCGHAILTPDVITIVEDAQQDARFSNSPLVIGPPYIRFYAGAPILDPDGQPLGTVCVIDRRKRTLTDAQTAALAALAHQASVIIGFRSLSVTNQAELKRLTRSVSEAFADISESSAALLRKQRIDTIGQLTSGVAHDFNNLLQALSVNFQILQRKADEPDAVRKWTTKGLETVQRGAQLVTHLLAMSKNRASSEELVDVAEQLRSCVDMFERVLPSHIQLRLELEETATVACDPIQLESAVLNLVINARDAMKHSGIVILRTRARNISGHAELADGHYVSVQIEDNGCGMPTAVAEKVFEPFFTTKGDKGTGLGLAQVLGFALRAEGVASIESHVGIGTTVTLHLKSTNQKAAGISAKTDTLPAPIATVGKFKVLLIEDDQAVREALATLLDESGFLVVPVASAFAAFPLVEHYAPDLVVSDWSLPGLGGNALVRVFREIMPEAPIIFLTGDEDVVESFDHDTGIALLQKPITGDALVDLIHRSMSH